MQYITPRKWQRVLTLFELNNINGFPLESYLYTLCPGVTHLALVPFYCKFIKSKLKEILCGLFIVSTYTYNNVYIVKLNKDTKEPKRYKSMHLLNFHTTVTLLYTIYI